LLFGGCCEEALDFYQAALDAQVDLLLRYQDSPEPLLSSTLQLGSENKVMHATFFASGKQY
jgi:PhnB protein